MQNIFKPILFSTPMVQAILNGTKTQTRREIKKKYSNTDHVFKTDKYGTRLIERQNDVPKPTKNPDGSKTYRITFFAEVKPKYQKGDILWVRETWKISPEQCTWQKYSYKADYPYLLSELGKWKPSIHMPKKAARIFLKVTNVRVERLHDISEADAIAEGVRLDPDFGYWCSECSKKGHGASIICEDGFFKTAKEAFRSLWISINGLDSWEQNPYVWVYDFERIKKPQNF